MNGRLAKKLRQYSRRNWRAFYNDIKSLPLGVRIGIAWHIVLGGEK